MTKRYKHVVTGQYRDLTDECFKRLSYYTHNGQTFKNGGFQLAPEEPKSEAAKEVLSETENKTNGRGKTNK